MKYILHTSRYILREYLTFFPVILLVMAFFVPAEKDTWWLVAIILLYLIGLCFGTLIQNEKRYLYIGFILLCAVCSAWLFYSSIINSIVIFALCAIAVFRGMQYTYIEGQLLLPIHFQWSFGVSFYFIGYFLFKYIEALTDYHTFITIGGMLFVVILLFVSNADHLQQATLSKKTKDSVNKVIQKQNRFYIGAMIGTIFLLTQFEMVKSLLIFAIRTFFQAIYQFFNLFSNDSPIEEPPEQGPVEMPFFSEEEIKEPSLFFEILEVIATVAVFIGLIIGVCILLYKISKNFRQLIQKMYQFIYKIITLIGTRGPSTDSGEAYQDEKEILFDLSNWRENMVNRTKQFVKKRFSREKKWEELSADERVRHLYRKLLTKALREGYTFKKSETAHECLSRIEMEHAISKELQKHLDKLYNEARYSQKNIDNPTKEDYLSLLDEK